MNPADQNPVNSDTAPNLTQELAHITQEMYKKNLELAERNKTLFLLRQIDIIILSTVTDTKQVAQQVVDIVSSETDIKGIVIFTLTGNTLIPLAASHAQDSITSQMSATKSLFTSSIPLSTEGNIVSHAVIKRIVQTSTNLFDILYPFQTEDEARKIQTSLKIVSSLIYPLIVRNEVIGALVINLGEAKEKLSEYQSDLMDRLSSVVGIALDNALLYQKIQDANEKLKELDRLKDEFVSLASHELRTPMTVIKSYVWTLLEGKIGELTDKQKLYLSRTYTSVNRLINLVNDMLNISRIESGRMSLSRAQIDMNILLHETVSEMLARAQDEGISLELQPVTSLPQVFADPDKIKEVVINLIGNSLKFTPRGGTIWVRVFQKNEEIVIQVSDNGKGVSQEDLPKLFKKFNMLGPNSLTKQTTQGTGLGLYLSKSLVELHGGRMWVDSEGEGKGATFSFTLPIVATQAQAASQVDSPSQVNQNKQEALTNNHFPPVGEATS